MATHDADVQAAQSRRASADQTRATDDGPAGFFSTSRGSWTTTVVAVALTLFAFWTVARDVLDASIDHDATACVTEATSARGRLECRQLAAAFHGARGDMFGSIAALVGMLTLAIVVITTLVQAREHRLNDSANRRTQRIAAVTTLLDHMRHEADALAELRQRRGTMRLRDGRTLRSGLGLTPPEARRLMDLRAGSELLARELAQMLDEDGVWSKEDFAEAFKRQQERQRAEERSTSHPET